MVFGAAVKPWWPAGRGCCGYGLV